MTTWTKTSEGRCGGYHVTYRGTVNGRQFVLHGNRKTYTRTDSYPQFVCIGRKPRYSYTSTWYTVVEVLADGSRVERTDLNSLPGSFKEAKAFAARVAQQTV